MIKNIKNKEIDEKQFIQSSEQGLSEEVLEGAEEFLEGNKSSIIPGLEDTEGTIEAVRITREENGNYKATFFFKNEVEHSSPETGKRSFEVFEVLLAEEGVKKLYEKSKEEKPEEQIAADILKNNEVEKKENDAIEQPPKRIRIGGDEEDAQSEKPRRTIGGERSNKKEKSSPIQVLSRLAGKRRTTEEAFDFIYEELKKDEFTLLATEGVFRKDLSKEEKEKIKDKIFNPETKTGDISRENLFGYLSVFKEIAMKELVLKNNKLIEAFNTPDNHEKILKILINMHKSESSDKMLLLFFHVMIETDKKSESNLMNFSNLAMIFSPAMMKEEERKQGLGENVKNNLEMLLQDPEFKTIVRKSLEFSVVTFSEDVKEKPESSEVEKDEIVETRDTEEVLRSLSLSASRKSRKSSESVSKSKTDEEPAVSAELENIEFENDSMKSEIDEQEDVKEETPPSTPERKKVRGRKSDEKTDPISDFKLEVAKKLMDLKGLKEKEKGKDEDFNQKKEEIIREINSSPLLSESKTGKTSWVFQESEDIVDALEKADLRNFAKKILPRVTINNFDEEKLLKLIKLDKQAKSKFHETFPNAQPKPAESRSPFVGFSSIGQQVASAASRKIQKAADKIGDVKDTIKEEIKSRAPFKKK